MTNAQSPAPPLPEAAAPHESLGRLFLRFLRFGLLAWGGPVAHIAMIKQQIVDEERWIEPERFNRVLAVYQVLPGPEATELCVYFGYLARGRIGAVLAGLGFMLPGFIFMMALSWLYATHSLDTPVFKAVFYGFQPAVAALIIRAVHRIGGHALRDRWLWIIAAIVGVCQLLGVSFWITLGFAGIAYALIKRQMPRLPAQAVLILPPLLSTALQTTAPGLLMLFVYGLRSGLLTFGGAYTVIPFLQYDAVVVGGWMTNQQFLDGLALSSILPAPLIIVATFVGYMGGGPLGAVALTVGIFLPAFAFTLIGHSTFEKLVENKAAHAFLDGIAAGVVGLIAATTINLMLSAIPDWPALVIFAAALITLYLWKAKAAIAGVMLGAGLLGILLFSL